MTIRLCSRTTISFLSAAGVSLVAAFVFGPAALLSGTYGDYQGEGALQDSVGRALVEYWRGDEPAFPAPLARLVDYWFEWHAIKVLISASMLAVFALLAVSLWRRYLRGTAGHAVAAVGATIFSVLASGLLTLNLQATAEPLIALLPLVNGEAAGGDLARTLREMRDGLTATAGPHADSPVLAVLVGELERYHWVMVAVSAIAMASTALAGAFLWKHRRTSRPRLTFMRRTLSVTLTLTAALFLTVMVVSALSAGEPSNALLAALGLE